MDESDDAVAVSWIAMFS